MFQHRNVVHRQRKSLAFLRRGNLVFLPEPQVLDGSGRTAAEPARRRNKLRNRVRLIEPAQADDDVTARLGMVAEHDAR